MTLLLQIPLIPPRLNHPMPLVEHLVLPGPLPHLHHKCLLRESRNRGQNGLLAVPHTNYDEKSITEAEYRIEKKTAQQTEKKINVIHQPLDAFESLHTQSLLSTSLIFRRLWLVFRKI